MALSNEDNVTKRIDVNRRLSFSEMDENFEQLKLVITDAGNLEVQLGDKVSTVVYDAKIADVDQSILDLENALVGTVSTSYVNNLESRISVNEDNILVLENDVLNNDSDIQNIRNDIEDVVKDAIFKDSSFTALVGDWYSLGATSSFTITLPANPVNGDIIRFILLSGDAEINNLTVARNGQTIEGLTEDMTIDRNYPRNFRTYFNGTTWRVAV